MFVGLDFAYFSFQKLSRKPILFHFFFPNQCVVCHRIHVVFRFKNICKLCWPTLYHPECIRSGTYECFSMGSYQGPQKSLIVSAKFRADPFSVSVLEKQLVLGFRSISKIRYDFFTCVPGSLTRLRSRKIDLPYYLARKLSNRIGVPFEAGLIHHSRKIQNQIHLNREERRKNMQRSFRAGRSLLGKKIAVIDDIYTTGATCESIVNSLYEVDAQHVTLFVLGKTPEPTT